MISFPQGMTIAPMKEQFAYHITAAVLICTGVAASNAYAQASGLAECPSRHVDVKLDEQAMTAEEMLQLLEKRLFESGMEFEECLKTGYAASGSAASAAASAANQYDDTLDTTDGEDGYANSATSGYDGGEGGEVGEDQSLNETTLATTGASAESDTSSSEPDRIVLDDEDSGKIPDDIPPADTDSAFTRQLRTAAMEEPDPDKRAQLWNLYREYRNLPAK